MKNGDKQHDEIERTAIRKISWRLLPLLGLGYGIALTDRTNISYAALQMNEDLHFSATVYGFGAGLFFLSYAIFEVPSNLLLMRFGARRWIARIMFTWGLLATGMLFVRTNQPVLRHAFFAGYGGSRILPGRLILYETVVPAPLSRASN